VVDPVLFEAAQTARVHQQHGERVLSDGGRVRSAHVGDHDLALGQAGYLPHPFDARARRLDPAQLLRARELLRGQHSVYGIDVVHQRRGRLTLVWDYELDAVRALELGKSLQVALKRTVEEHFHCDPFCPRAEA
jgi:hypothetical protein